VKSTPWTLLLVSVFCGWLVLVGPASVATDSTDAAVPKFGERVAEFRFTDIRYLPRSLDELGAARAYVLLFTTLDCPVVARYLPLLGAMQREYRDRQVQFVAVNVGPGDDLREIAYQALRSECDFPFVKDFDRQVVRAVGAQRAGQVVVLDAHQRLQYSGRIDDRFRLGGERAEPTREDLREAIEAVLEERPVEKPSTPIDGCLITPLPTPPVEQGVTFAEHVEPILREHCQACHHAGPTPAPFPLVDYQDALDHAAMVVEVTRQQRMPPWYASERHGEFANERRLSRQQRQRLEDWLALGCPAGDLESIPPPLPAVDSRWKIGEPDLVVKTAVQQIPATGFIDYRYVILPVGFEEDTWVQGIQILPSNPAVMHHCNLLCIAPNEPPGARSLVTGQVPGGDPMLLDEHIGYRIPAGSSLVLQVHYVTVGEATTDQISVGFRYAKQRIDHRLQLIQVVNNELAISPNDPAHRVVARRTVPVDMVGYGMFSHMHVRGKDMTFSAVFPDGSRQKLLVIPNYNFDWQHSYRWPSAGVVFPAGTQLEVVAHFDNSAFNPYNPDPDRTVPEGQQTYDEMMYGFVFLVDQNERLGLMIDPATGHVIDRADAEASSAVPPPEASLPGG